MPKKKIHKKEKMVDSEPLESHHFVKKHLEEDVPKKKNSDDDYVSEQLVEIYKNQDGSLPDMTHFQKRKSQRTVRAFFTLLFSCLFLAAVVYAGVFYFGPKENFSKEGVTVEITGAEEVVSGEIAHYRIRYRNDETVPITQAKVVVHYPTGFEFKESSVPAANETKTEWDLATLDAGESGYIDIYGVMHGDFGTEESLRVFLNYTPANFSSEFQASAIAKVAFNESPVALTISGPATTMQGQSISLVFTLTARQSTSTLENLALVIDPGIGFVQKNSNPPSDNFGAWQWTIPSLKGETSITVVGAFAANPDLKEHTIKAKVLGSTAGTEAQRKTFVLTEKEYTVTFDEAQILGQFTINGTSEALNVTPGEMLTVNAALKNNLASNITNVHASVTFDAPSYQDKSILNWAKLQDKNNNSVQGEQVGTDIRRGVVSWDKTKISSLGSLAPQAEIPFSFSLPLKTSLEAPLVSFKEHRIEATFEVQYEKDGKKQTFVSAPIEITINSDVSIESTIEKVKNAASKDDFTVTWNLLNTVHDVKDVKMSAQVFGDITWEAGDLSVSSGKFEFDPKDKKILWTIDSLPASSDPVLAKFSFVRNTFNPTQTQLVSKINLSGKDVVTGKDVIVLKRETPNTP